MLGVFAKVVRGQRIKTRLQSLLSPEQAEQFYVASLCDTLETCMRVEARLVLFLQGGEDTAAVTELQNRLERICFDRWDPIDILPQDGTNLGERLECAFDALYRMAEPRRPCLIVGSDHPSLESRMLRDGLERLGSFQARATRLRRETERSTPDLVLGPVHDGGYWGIGVRRPIPGLLDGVAWSTERTLQDTLVRARALDLRVELLEAGIDVDLPRDLRTLARHLQALRARGDLRTGRHSEAALKDFSIANHDDRE